MRFKLILETNTNNNGNLLPLNYQYELSSWIYKTLNYGNQEFADWLHQEGYTNDYKNFKLFTFSNLLIDKYEIKSDRMKINSRENALIVSFYPINSLEYFVTGLFNNQQFTIGDKKTRAAFTIKTVEKLSEPEFKSTMEFKTLSPVLISYKNSENQKYAEYKHPEDDNYSDLLIKNLVEKYNAFYKAEANPFGVPNPERVKPLETANLDYELKTLTKPKSRLITIKSGTKQESKLRGYLYKFQIKAPAELIRLGYYAGFGEKNSLGFGCGEIVENE
ncbi:MAG: CRISPR-associated endoribonuclease Cas6 [Bacteroidales bacterium]